MCRKRKWPRPFYNKGYFYLGEDKLFEALGLGHLQKFKAREQIKKAVSHILLSQEKHGHVFLNKMEYRRNKYFFYGPGKKKVNKNGQLLNAIAKALLKGYKENFSSSSAMTGKNKTRLSRAAKHMEKWLYDNFGWSIYDSHGNVKVKPVKYRFGNSLSINRTHKKERRKQISLGETATAKRKRQFILNELALDLSNMLCNQTPISKKVHLGFIANKQVWQSEFINYLVDRGTIVKIKPKRKLRSKPRPTPRSRPQSAVINRNQTNRSTVPTIQDIIQRQHNEKTKQNREKKKKLDQKARMKELKAKRKLLQEPAKQLTDSLTDEEMMERYLSGSRKKNMDSL